MISSESELKRKALISSTLILFFTYIAIVCWGGASAKEIKETKSALEQIITFDTGLKNPHLERAEGLIRKSQNTAIRREALRFMNDAVKEILIGVAQVLPGDPDNELAMKMQRFLLDVGAEIEGALQMSDKTRKKYYELLEAAEAGDCEVSKRLAQEVLASVPGYAYARIVLGDCYFSKKDWITALKFYADSAKKAPNYARSYTRMAECYDHLGKQKEALSHYIKAVMLEPGSNALMESLKTYAYAHSYKVIEQRVPRRARVIITPKGYLKVSLDPKIMGMPRVVGAAWISLGLKKYILYREELKTHPEKGLRPSFDLELKAFDTLVSFWEETKARDPNIRDDDMDLLLQLRKEGLLEAFIYVQYFRPEFEESYREWRRSHSTEIRTVFEKYLVVPDPYQIRFHEGERMLAESKYQEALQAFEEAAQGFIKGRDQGIRKLLALCLTYQGRCSRILGRTEEAISYHRDALEFMREIGYQEGEAQVLNSLALTYRAVGRFDEALLLYQEALSIHLARHDVEGEISVLINMASLHLSRGEVHRAQELSERALAKSLASGKERGRDQILSNLGSIASAKGDYGRALGLYQEGLHIARAQLDLKNEITLLSNIGVLLDEIGQRDKAMVYCKMVLSKSRKLKDREHVAIALSNLGTLAGRAGDIKTSLNSFSEALNIRKEIKDRHGEAVTLLNLSGLSLELQDAASAMAFSKEALAISRELKDHLTEAGSLNNMASAYEVLGDYLKALTFYQESLEAARSIGNRRKEGIILANIGSCFEKMGSLERAVEAYRQSLAITESIRTSLRSEESRISYGGKQVDVYQALIRALFKLKDRPGAIEEAFHVTERSRARAFLDQLSEVKAKRFGGLPKEILSKERSLVDRLIKCEHALLKARSKPRIKQNMGFILKLEDEKSRLESELKDLRKEIEEEYPSYAALKYPQSLTVESLQKEVLEDGEAIIEYAVMDDKTYVFVVTKDIFRAYTVDIEKNKLWKIVDRLIALPSEIIASIGDQRTIARTLSKWKRQGSAIYDTLIRPLENDIKRVKQIFIIPDGDLYYLPFEALNARKGTQPEYVIERHTISYLPSSSVLKIIRETKGKDRPTYPLLAFADPVYPQDGTINTPSSSEITVKGLVGRSYSNLGIMFPPLPETKEEVERIALTLKISRDEIEKSLYMQQRASETSVKSLNESGALKDYRYIVFSTHGILGGEISQVMQPAIVLSLGLPDEKEDGFLQMGEVLGLEMNCDLVTLSACKTGLGEKKRGEGIVGLSRAFFYAGTPSINVTLWSVESQSAKEITVGIYEYLIEGGNKAEALRQAKLDLLRRKENPLFSHPFFWAPFILLGDWR